MTTMLVIIALVMIPMQYSVADEHESEHGTHEEYENDEYGGEGLKINVRVISPASDGKLSTCIDAEGFGLCNDREISDRDIITIVEMTPGVYSIPEGDSFKICVDFYGYDNSHYHQCQDVINHDNDNPEFVNVELRDDSNCG